MATYIWQKHDALFQAVTFFASSVSVGALRWYTRPTGNLETRDGLESAALYLEISPFISAVPERGLGLLASGRF